MATAHVLVRVWLPDRPGALGQVASRIGAVRGDIVGVDVLECDGGVAIDEFAVNLADPDLVSMLVREIEEVDGASVEEVRVVNHFPDPRLDALESAIKLCQVASVKELHDALVERVRAEFVADWAALIVGIGPAEQHVPGNGADAGEARVVAVSGDAPSADHVEALALGVAASPLVASGAAGPEDLAAAPLSNHRSVLLASRGGYALRERERGQLIALARIADRVWELLGGTA
jgi:23S rRNA U2552 (ribose-2'-O)-methylase RlmE/FtsJ